jgi:tripartite-type tricarboxylate transporter receptor subunit TctC
VHVIVGFPAGNNIDIVARLIGQWLSERLGQPFFIENRPGASGNIAAEAVVRAPADGHTLLMTGTFNAINATLYENLSFNFIRDIAPVASLSRTAGVMEVNPSFPAKTVPEFIAYAKANPGNIMMASAGPGSAPGLYGELFKSMAGVDLATVNYRGSPAALSDLIAGHVHVMFDPIASSVGYIKAGQLRALAVTTAKRIEILPDVPTIGEFVPGYEASGWQGIGAPAKTPPQIIATLNKLVNEALASTEFKARFVDLGLEPYATSPAEFGKFIVDYTEKWGSVIRAANIKAE